MSRKLITVKALRSNGYIGNTGELSYPILCAIEPEVLINILKRITDPSGIPDLITYISQYKRKDFFIGKNDEERFLRIKEEVEFDMSVDALIGE